jgi:hemerythrin
MLRALNGLFHQVSRHNRELVELNCSLETKVAERTQELSVANQRLEHLALTDALTNLPNRRHALQSLDLEWAESSKTGRPLTVMMIDADGFKKINDSHGHDAGDAVLRALASQLRDSVRTDDLVCRLGGDEFLILCPGTSLAGALQFAESLRLGVAELRAPAGAGEWRGSISVGVAERQPSMVAHEDLLKAADNAVYLAKQRGRNCVASCETHLLPA